MGASVLSTSRAPASPSPLSRPYSNWIVATTTSDPSVPPQRSSWLYETGQRSRCRRLESCSVQIQKLLASPTRCDQSNRARDGVWHIAVGGRQASPQCRFFQLL